MVRRADRFGRWETISYLGGGGNGVVWKVRDTSSGDLGAIKILTSPGRYRLARFRDEIRFLTDHAGYSGVLPLIDSELHNAPARQSWYVMPIAVPIRRALGRDPRPEKVVAAMAAIAETLAALAADGIGHRDIKPDNLFQLGEEWLIGDFGLVTYPEKEPLTEHGRKLGPIDYMAPEMRNDADSALPEPADVWALAKTLWVLLAGESAPLPGPHRPADPAYALRERITFDRSGELDLLLERATRMDRAARESLAGFARELRACLAPPAEAVASSTLPELQERIMALTMTEYGQVSESREWGRRRGQVLEGLLALLDETRDKLAEILTTFSSDRNYEEWPNLLGQRLAASSAMWGAWSQGRRLISPGDGRAVVVVVAGYRLLQETGPIDIAAELNVEHRYGKLADVRIAWEGFYTVPIGSAQQDHAFAAIRAGLAAAFGDALRRTAEILAGRSVPKDLPDGSRTLEIEPCGTEAMPPAG